MVNNLRRHSNGLPKNLILVAYYTLPFYSYSFYSYLIPVDNYDADDGSAYETPIVQLQ